MQFNITKTKYLSPDKNNLKPNNNIDNDTALFEQKYLPNLVMTPNRENHSKLTEQDLLSNNSLCDNE